MNKRILKSEKILAKLMAHNDTFYIGLPIEDVMQSTALIQYGLNKKFTENSSIQPHASGSATKQNINGKFIRKQPEEKITKRKRITYTRRTDGAYIDYVRDFHIYAKELSHKFNISFYFKKNKHGQELLVSPLLTFANTPDSNTLSTHVINMFLEIFGTYEVFTNQLEPAIVFNKKFEFDILPKGEIKDDDINYLVEGARRTLKKEEDVSAYMKRLKIIQEYNPEIIGKGPDGFFGYIVFEFKNLGVVLLESMYMGNATYIFSIGNYEKLIAKNKQEVLHNKLAIKRFFHHINWEEAIRNYFLIQKKAA